jgi:hypothetical protein
MYDLKVLLEYSNSMRELVTVILGPFVGSALWAFVCLLDTMAIGAVFPYRPAFAALMLMGQLTQYCCRASLLMCQISFFCRVGFLFLLRPNSKHSQKVEKSCFFQRSPLSLVVVVYMQLTRNNVTDFTKNCKNTILFSRRKFNDPLNAVFISKHARI